MVDAEGARAVAYLVKPLDGEEAGDGWRLAGPEVFPDRAGRMGMGEAVWVGADKAVDKINLLKRIVDGFVVGGIVERLVSGSRV